MASVVFDCDIDVNTVRAIMELRTIRKNVLLKQIEGISQTMKTLEDMGALDVQNRAHQQQAVLGELREKLLVIERRIEQPQLVHSDELELYLDLLSEPGS